MGNKVKIENLVQQIVNNIKGVQFCLLINNNGQILLQRSSNDFPINNIALLLIKTIFNTSIEVQFNKIKNITLEGTNNKLILSYFPKQDVYIGIYGAKTIMAGIVQFYLNKIIN